MRYEARPSTTLVAGWEVIRHDEHHKTYVAICDEQEARIFAFAGNALDHGAAEGVDGEWDLEAHNNDGYMKVYDGRSWEDTPLS